MISTGGTIIAAADKLKQEGAKEISVLVTHGIFADKALRKISKSSIEYVYTTNTLKQKRHTKIRLINIAPFLEKIIKKN